MQKIGCVDERQIENDDRAGAANGLSVAPSRCAVMSISQAEVMNKLKEVWNAVVLTAGMLKSDGLFRFDHIKAFCRDLLFPLKPEIITNPRELMSIAFVQTRDLADGFIFMNALGFWLEVGGSLIAFLFGRPIPLFIFEVIYAFLVAYVLYWLVIKSEGQGKEFYVRVAIGLFVLYSLVNALTTMGSLALIIPPIFYAAKTVCSLACGMYAFKIREPLAGHAMLVEEGGVHVTDIAE